MRFLVCSGMYRARGALFNTRDTALTEKPLSRAMSRIVTRGPWRWFFKGCTCLFSTLAVLRAFSQVPSELPLCSEAGVNECACESPINTFEYATKPWTQQSKTV